MAERAMGMDAAMLEMESPTMHMHILGVLVLDPSTAPGPWSPRCVEDLYAERLHLLPPFRRRVVAVPGGLDHPRWVEDEAFDLQRHIHHVDLGGDADRSDLERFIGDLAGIPLRRDAPLWEVWVVEGFADGTVAVASKIHHALMDGSASGDVLASLLELTPDAGPVPEAAPWVGERSPSPGRLLLEAGPAALGRMLQIPVTLARTVTGVVSSRRQVAAAPSALVGLAPASPFNGALSPRRRAAFRRCAFDDVVAIKQAFGATVNDVVLVATTLALRGYLEMLGEPRERPLVASVPVGGRHEGESFGNHTSNVMVGLPVHLDDPAEMFEVIHRDAAGAKAAKGALDSRVLDAWIGVLPAALLQAGSRLYSGLHLGQLQPPLFNTIVSNVVGPPVPLYMAGARLVGLYPMGPLIGNAGLNVTVLSLDGAVDVGIIACPGLVDDVAEVADEFEAAVARLLDLAGQIGRADPQGSGGEPGG